MNLPTEGALPGGGDEPHDESRPPRKIGDLQKTITMAQIAKAAGVSQGAISSLLNDRDYGIRVSEKTRERVFKVCREMGYLPNDLRAVVRMYPELGGFALLISNRFWGGLAHPVVARTVAAAVAAVPETSRSLTIAFYEDGVDYGLLPDLLPQPVASGTFSKFIILGPPNGSLIQALTKRGHPVVLVGHESALSGVHSLLANVGRASQVALEHLAHLGHRRLAIVSGPFGTTDTESLELNRGVRLACEQLGLSLDAPRIVHGDLTAAAGQAAFPTLLDQQPAPTAIFCLGDAAAAGVLAAAQARGINVPGQLSVVGCGDDPYAALLAPALTTVRFPYEEMAALAVQEVEELVRQGNVDQARRTVLPVRLIERGSTGPVSA